MAPITVPDLEQHLPKHLKAAATQSLADKINQISTDPEAARAIRDNFISYTRVLKEGRFKTEDYLNAVAYVSYKVMGLTNQEAYKRTFPGRYQALVARGASDKDVSAYVAMYNKNKLVNLVLEQTVIPPWVLYQDALHHAVRTQTELMLDPDVSPKVRSDAANSILTHLKKPETKQVDLNIGMPETSGLGELKDMLTALAQQSQELIAQGIQTQAIARQDLGGQLVEGKARDVTPK